MPRWAGEILQGGQYSALDHLKLVRSLRFPLEGPALAVAWMSGIRYGP
jgi:hypothetical protein